ncbi:MAG: alkaline phosphatase [Pseudomonadota bacterium]
MLNQSLIAAASLSIVSCAAVGEIGAFGQREIADPVATGDAWFDAGATALADRKRNAGETKRARNVILFVGDGMDINTVTAARILAGQAAGGPGENHNLSFDAFHNVAFSKTYTVDFQVSDSAGTASAMNTGVKTRSGVINVKAAASRGDCASGLANEVVSLAERAEDAGLATGVVTTTELTHATPAAVFAHSADRGWGADSDMPEQAVAAGCIDIARQLIEFDHGDGIDIALGGGRAHFLPADAADPEYPERMGARADGRDLASEWADKSPAHRYVWNRADFEAADPNEKLLGLFEPGHMQFEVDRPDDGAGEPSLAAMTARAITKLESAENGYYLMVEAGRIDHAHHGGNAYRALKDTIALSDAVATARSMTDEADTLIIVTADHGHVMAIQGYPARGNDILGLVTVEGEGGPDALNAVDGKPYSTLAYMNGPGTVFRPEIDLSDGRPAPTAEDVADKNYRQQALIPTSSETHGGQDVPVYASGPNAHLVSGVMEQNVIYHVMADALGL